MTINERFESIIQSLYSGNKRAFALAIGVNPTVIENVVGKRQGKPSYDVLEKICANANISADWLLTGEGNMLKDALKEDSDTNKTVIEPSSENIQTLQPIDEDMVSIPILDISAAAGTGYYNDSYEEEVDCIRLPENMLERHGKYRCIRIKGESMAPTLLDSSYLIIRQLEPSEWKNIRDGYIYVVSDREGRTFVKRLKNRLERHGFITLMSDNLDKNNYPNFNLEESELLSIHYAEWYLSAKMPDMNAGIYKRVSNLEDKMDDMSTQINQFMKSINKK